MAILTGRRAERTDALRTRPPDRAARRGRAAAGRLSALFSIILGIAALAACTPAQPSVKAPTATAPAAATATPSATAVPRLLYQADWSHGLTGWKATPGWSISGGSLVSDMGSDRQITSPYRPTTSNYAVEFSLQVINVMPNVGTEYQLSADSTASADGYYALFDHVMLQQCMFACHPHLAVYIDPLVDQDVGTGTVQIHDFEPETHLHTYRIEVRGPLATLLYDGHVASHARTSRTQLLSTGAIHFYCTGVALRLSDFKVYAL